MPSSDPVGDMLAMIKNAYGRRHKRISLTHSKLKEGVAKVLRSYHWKMSPSFFGVPVQSANWLMKVEFNPVVEAVAVNGNPER